MRTVWKFEAEVDDSLVFDMPGGARVLAAGSQRPGHLCLWAEVETDARPRTRTFIVRGTGQPLPDKGPYVGTVVDGGLVWHVFEALR